MDIWSGKKLEQWNSWCKKYWLITRISSNSKGESHRKDSKCVCVKDLVVALDDSLLERGVRVTPPEYKSCFPVSVLGSDLQNHVAVH